MSSSDRSDLLDLDRGLPTTPDDVAALRRLRQQPLLLTPRESLLLLAALPQPSPEALRSRSGPRGEPFRL